MARGTPVPITPEVLAWAIRESGFPPSELASRLKVTPPTLSAWQSGEEKPHLTEFRKLARLLKRPAATFFLPEPPPSSFPTVRFRHPGAQSRTHLNPDERRWLRESHRLQKAAAWIEEQLGRPRPTIPRAVLGDGPEAVAASVRDQLGITIDDQLDWKNASEAQRAWRSRLEETGLLVFLLSIGKESCRGFSLWNERAPLIAVNTAWNHEARIFTLFHELGHLLTRSDSACIGSWRQLLPRKGDAAERWCEQFAAAVLLPWPDLEAYVSSRIGWRLGTAIDDLGIAGKVARRFKTSLRATVLRLIDHQVATWDLYRAIPSTVDHKKGGGGGRGRDLSGIRSDQYGERTAALFREAIERDVLSRDDALTYLDIPEPGL